nr:uncharacterized protein LOC101241137 isoform X2 [Hydra vulgaris]
MESTGSRFLFQKRNEKIDWRRLAGLDINRIANEVDVDAIQENIATVTYCNIEYELGHDSLDPNFIKLFRLAQLMIEYLLHCQQYLQASLEEKQNTINLVTEHIQAVQQQEAATKNELNLRNEMYKKLKKEFNKAKVQIADYQLMIRAGASGQYKCVYCNKSFVSEFYLSSHLQRRHPNESQKMFPLSPTSLYNSQVQNEINVVRERLLATEAELIAEKQKIKIIQNEDSLKNEKLMQDIQKEHALWKNQEQEKMKTEIENFKNIMLEEMRLMQKEKELLQQNIYELEKSSGKKKSNLGSLMDEDDLDYKSLSNKIEALEKDFQLRLNENAKNEVLQKKKYEKALKAERAKLELSEKARAEESKLYKDQIDGLYEKLNKHEELLKKSQLHSENTLITLNNPSTPADNISIENEVCLWVSCNLKVNGIHRVSLKPAYKTTDWKDIFSFYAPLTPKGEFNKPVYVYSCGGSPFWRQYISFSDSPPNSSYKNDLIFYVANNKLAGTIKLYIHYAGSASVVHSMISEKKNVKNWTNKDVSFYTIKTVVSKNSLSNSGFTVTNLSDSDEVSVSSIDGNNEVKGMLAVDLQKSRENLLQDDSESNKQSYDSESEDLSQQQEEKDESVQSNAEYNNDLTSSGSIFNTTLPEKGTYQPYSHNPLAIARYKPNQQVLDAQRNEIIDILEENLAKYGIAENETQMSTSVFNSKMSNHAKEAELKERTFPGILKLRQEIQTQLDEFVTKQWMKRKKENAFKSLKKKANVIKAFIKPGKSTTETRDIVTRALPSISVEHSNYRDDVQNKKKVRINNESINSPDDSEENKFSMKNHESRLTHDFSKENKANNELSNEIKNDVLSYYESSSSDDFDVSQSSDWESDSIQKSDAKRTEKNEISEQLYPVSSNDQTEIPYNPKMRPPKGDKVRELAASLEASLTLRDPNIKIAGAVDTINVPKSNLKRSVAFKEEDDEDSDFSLDESPEPRNGVGGQQYFEDYDKELDDILSGLKPKPSSSSTPDKKSSKNHTEATMVTDFFDDSL